MGFEKINFLASGSVFRYLIVYSEVWKESGWETIIYLATIAGIDKSLYEAAKIDGANRWQKIRYIVWPGLKGVVILLFILNVGHIMNAGFMQILNLYNPTVYEVGDILDTYIFRTQFSGSRTPPNMGVGTAVGLFTGVVNCIFLLTANKISKWFAGIGLY